MNLDTTSTQRTQPVTAENFARSETDWYVAQMAERGGFGTFIHRREPLRVEKQVVIRGNPDAFTSQAVFDLDAGPVTVTLPESQGRLMSLQVIDQDHYSLDLAYAPATVMLTRQAVGTRYVVVLIRTLVDPWNADDVAQTHALQDAVRVQQTAKGTLELPAWDRTGRDEIRQALLVLAKSLPDTTRMFGRRDDVDAIRHLIGAAYAWGGQPAEHAYYLNVTPERNDGSTVHCMRITEVPVDGYWSVTVYNAKGYLQRNALERYTVNSVNAKRSADGSVEIRFGGCDAESSEDAGNCIPVMAGWNYFVRLYRAKPEVLDGRWQFPSAIPLKAHA